VHCQELTSGGCFAYWIRPSTKFPRLRSRSAVVCWPPINVADSTGRSIINTLLVSRRCGCCCRVKLLSCRLEMRNVNHERPCTDGGLRPLPMGAVLRHACLSLTKPSFRSTFFGASRIAVVVRGLWPVACCALLDRSTLRVHQLTGTPVCPAPVLGRLLRGLCSGPRFQNAIVTFGRLCVVLGPAPCLGNACGTVL